MECSPLGLYFDFGLVRCGPIRLVWIHSGLTDYRVVVEKLQSALPKETRFIGFGVPEKDGSSCYVWLLYLRRKPEG